MNADPRRYLPLAAVALVVIVLIVAIVAGRGSSEPSPSPGPSGAASGPASAIPASVSPSAGPGASGSPAPSPNASVATSAVPSPTAAPSRSATAVPSATVAPPPSAVACAVKPADGLLPSDRVVSVKVATSPGMDFVTFVFEEGSLTPAGPPRGKLTVAKPPFSQASSGLPIDLHGQRALQVRMSGMSLYNDVGEPTFTGDPDILADMPALKQVVMFDASEGIAAWYIGYDGNGCVDLVRDGMNVTVTIAHS